MSRCLTGWIILWLCWPVSAWATQSHGGPEGLHVHQLAHLFFAFTMGLLIFWLRKWRLVTAKGWRYIQYAAIFFIAWNMDAFLSHWLEELSELMTIQSVGVMQIRIQAAEGYTWLVPLYYLTKLDHLLVVPAMIFWFLGFRRLLKTPHAANGIEDATP
jgi:hypothetical protein